MKPAREAVILTAIVLASLVCAGQAMADGTTYRNLQTNEIFKKGNLYSESIDMLFDVKQGGGLFLGTTHGSVRVNTWSQDKVRLVVTKSTAASSPYNARTILEHFLVQAKHQGGDLHLKAQANTEACKKSVGVTFTVWVPKNYNVAIDTGSGNVKIGKLNGTFSAKTGNGKISFECEPEGMDIEVEDRTNDPRQGESPAVGTDDSEEIKPAKPKLNGSGNHLDDNGTI